MSDTAVTVVEIREARRPHGRLLEMLVPGIKYSYKVRKTGTASFMLPRSDPNVTNFLNSILQNEPAMVTIVRPDGYLPWVGFLSNYKASQADPHVQFQCSDHSWRFSSNGGGRTRKNQFFNTSSGRVIKQVFADMEDRCEPPLFLNYQDVPDGPAANFEVRMDFGLDSIEQLAQQANYEWGFAYNVGAGVESYLTWNQKQGVDRRNEEAWQEQRHFVSADYELDYAMGIRSSVVVGGTGLTGFGARPAVATSQSGQAPDLSATPRTPVSAFGLGGTRIALTQRVTDPSVLKQQAQQQHEAPEYAAEQFSFKVLESAIDMSRFGLGDVRTVRLATTSLGTAIERVVRVIGIQMDPDTRVHDVEVVPV